METWEEYTPPPPALNRFISTRGSVPGSRYAAGSRQCAVCGSGSRTTPAAPSNSVRTAVMSVNVKIRSGSSRRMLAMPSAPARRRISARSSSVPAGSGTGPYASPRSAHNCLSCAGSWHRASRR